jgi:Flp pilus assembly protein TadG
MASLPIRTGRTTGARLPRRLATASRERGSAVVEFVVVVPLLLVVTATVLQVVLALHVRTTLASAAAEGARAGALAGASPAAARARVREVLEGTVSSGAVTEVRARRAVVRGVPTIETTVGARLPLLGLLGPETLTVQGHAVVER